MTEFFAVPSCSIEVYPFEGGPWVLTPGQIREVMVEKSLRGGSLGRASITLAPGGPYGAESTPTWTQVATPMSHVLIGMSRGSNAAIVMDGVVVRAGEAQQWATSDQMAAAARVPTIEVNDFSWYFRSFNYYALTYYGLTSNVAVGQALGYTPAGLPYALNKGLLGGTGEGPAYVAKGWYTDVMAGSGSILGQTFVPYQGSQINFPQLLGGMWEELPNAYIPVTETYMAAEGDWMSKFLDMLPPPWYEFFVTTASSGAYTLASGAKGSMTTGRQFTMQSQPKAAPAGPMVVARLNPIPIMGLNSDASGQKTSIGSLDLTRWQALALSTPDSSDTTNTQNFMFSEVVFSADEARNFYMLNPTQYATAFGTNNANNVPWMFSFFTACDPASVHRYGYHPEIGTFRWFFDPTGTFAQSVAGDVPQSAATAMSWLVSWWHPLPLMARATVTIPLNPKMMVGTRFRYAPFKDGVPWDFYIESVRHRFIFNGQSSTTLGLCRGLPASIYADSSDGGLLKAIYTGNAMRQKGVYTKGLLPNIGTGLQTFGQPAAIEAMLKQIAPYYVTPQPGGQ